MLFPSDEPLVANEPGLRGLRTLLDGDALARLLDTIGLGGIGPIEPCYVRYKPGTNCLVQYRLAAEAPYPSLYAIAFHQSERDKVAKIKEGGLEGAFLDEEAGIAIYPFGRDRRLPAMALATDSECRRDHVERILPQDPGLWSANLVTLRYKPERRYVGYLDSPGQRVLFKLYTPERYAAARRNSKVFRSHGSLVIARRLAGSNRNRTLAFEWIPGHSLESLLQQPDETGSVAWQVGQALANFHLQRPRRIQKADLEDGCQALARAGRNLLDIYPQASSRIADLHVRVRALLQKDVASTTAIHGDFSADQLVQMADGRMAILDLDSAACGDPAADFGSFMAALEVDAIYGKRSEEQILSIATALQDGYGQIAPPPSPDRFRAHLAARLLRLAVEPFRYRYAEWPVLTAAILTRVEEIVDL